MTLQENGILHSQWARIRSGAGNEQSGAEPCSDLFQDKVLLIVLTYEGMKPTDYPRPSHVIAYQRLPTSASPARHLFGKTKSLVRDSSGKK